MHALRDCIDRELDPVSLEAEGVLVNHIAEHLSRFKTTQVTDALLAALRRRPYAYCAAALGLTGDPCAIPVLVACLFEDPVRPAAAAALRKFGRTALPWLMAAALERKTIGPTESPTRLLGRAAATELVGECMGSGDADVLTLLRRALNDPERSVQLEAARALARGPTADAQRAGAILAGALDDPDWKRVQTTANALAQLPNADRLIVDIIATRGNGDTDRRRRLRAVVLAGRLRLPAAVPRLRSLAAAADPKLRIAAICALGQIPTANSEAIARFLTDREPVIRWHALQILLRQHALTADCATPFLGDEDPEVRRLADASVREDLGAAVPALHRAALQFGAPLQGWSPRLRLWWHAWRLLAARAPVRRRDSR
jgi:HEAT repeat protein